MRESGFYCMFNFIRPFEVDKINDCLVFYWFKLFFSFDS
jgi:hypothetical protein